MVRLSSACTAFVISLGTLTAHAQSTPCSDLWFARTATLIAAGQCPDSPLASEVFDGVECTEGQATLDSAAEGWIASIVAREVEFGCNLSEESDTLALENVALRKELLLQPIRRQRELICVMNAPTSLWSSPDIDVAEQIGWLDKGDTISVVHDIEGGVAFASEVKRRRQTTDLIGWFGRTHCKAK